MTNNIELVNEARAWIKRKSGPGEIIRVVRDTENSKVACYQFFTAFDQNPDYLGRILFDTQGYWIYDGEALTVSEQEQLAKFIIKYIKECRWDS